MVDGDSRYRLSRAGDGAGAIAEAGAVGRHLDFGARLGLQPRDLLAAAADDCKTKQKKQDTQ